MNNAVVVVELSTRSVPLLILLVWEVVVMIGAMVVPLESIPVDQLVLVQMKQA